MRFIDEESRGRPSDNFPESANQMPHETDLTTAIRRHLLMGWWGLALFVLLGLLLETMHGLKVNYYLDVRNETRRLMWTLAHAHGTLLSIVHIAWGVTLAAAIAKTAAPPGPLAFWGLTAGWVLVPLGFFLGGLWIYDGDPGIGVLLVPAGALLLLAGITAAGRYLWREA